MRTVLAGCLTASLLCLVGCPTNYLDLGHDLPDAGTGTGGATSTPCEPGAVSPCYAGPAGTEGVGLCKAGAKTCNAQGTAWGACTGEVHPEVDNCAAPTDEDCNGLAPWCTGDLLWSKRFGGSTDQEAHGLAIDGAGNVLVTGYITGAADFGGGPLQTNGQSVFLGKLDPSGKHLWSKRFGDAATPTLAGASIAVDSGGSVFVTGYITGAADFGGGLLQSAGGTDIFLAKLDASGKHLWSKTIGDASNQAATSIAVDSGGGVLVTGSFDGSADFGGGLVQSAGLTDIFLAKFDASGKHQWSKTFGDADKQGGQSVAVDSIGNVLVTGYLFGSADFGGGPLQSAGLTDIFLAKLDASGKHLWSKRFGDTGEQVVVSVAVDSAGNPLVTGYFTDAASFGGGPVQSAGGYDIFLAKLDASGKHLWSKRFGDAGEQTGTGVAVDAQGNGFVTGSFNSAADFGEGLLQSAGGSDIFLAKFAP